MFSIPEKICLMAWEMAWQDGTNSESKATEKEKNLVRATRKFFELDTETFNTAHDRKKSDYTSFYEDLGKSDPITQIASLWLSLKVAYADFENSSDGKNLSDDEWQWFKRKLEYFDLPYFKVRDDISKTKQILKNNSNIKYKEIIQNDKVAKVSIVGAGMVSTTGVTYRMFRALSDEKINILAISTSEIKLSVIIDEDNTLKAIKKLHTVFDLD